MVIQTTCCGVSWIKAGLFFWTLKKTQAQKNSKLKDNLEKKLKQNPEKKLKNRQHQLSWDGGIFLRTLKFSPLSPYGQFLKL